MDEMHRKTLRIFLLPLPILHRPMSDIPDIPKPCRSTVCNEGSGFTMLVTIVRPEIRPSNATGPRKLADPENGAPYKRWKTHLVCSMNPDCDFPNRSMVPTSGHNPKPRASANKFILIRGPAGDAHTTVAYLLQPVVWISGSCVTLLARNGAPGMQRKRHHPSFVAQDPGRSPVASSNPGTILTS